MILAEERHLATFAKRYQKEEYILAWDISDEPEWWTRIAGADEEALPYNREKFAAWTRRMYHAFKDNDPNHMVTMGVGHIVNGNYGMDLKDMADTLDLMSITCYTDHYGEGIDKARPGFFYDWNVDMNRFDGRSVYLCECPGGASYNNFEGMKCGQYESAIFGGWLHGSVGTMPWAYNYYSREIWTNRDLDGVLREEDFNVVEPDGTLRPHGKTLCEIARVMKKIDAPQYKLRKPQAAILIPEGYHVHVNKSYGQLREAYAALVAGDVPLDTVWMTEEYERYPFLILSSTHTTAESAGLRGSETRRLKEYVENGGCLLYFWHFEHGCGPYFEETFGARPGFSRCLWEDEDRMLTFRADIGGVKAGESLPLHEKVRGYLRVGDVRAEILATVDDGRPCILHNRIGKGQAILVAADIMAGICDISPKKWAASPLPGLAAGLLERMGLKRPVVCSDNNVECGIMRSNREDTHLVVVINRNDKTCENPVFIKNMHGFVAETPDGGPVPCRDLDGGLKLSGPFAPGKATLVLLKKK